jgi:hypothetical protein
MMSNLSFPSMHFCFGDLMNSSHCQALHDWLCSVEDRVQRVGWMRMNELVLNSAGKLKMCMMPLYHNECFSVSLTDISSLTPFRVGRLLLNTHAHRPHTTTLSISFTAYTCEQLGFQVLGLLLRTF